MVTYLMNKSHRQALDIFDTAPLLFWQPSASLSIFPSVLLLFFLTPPPLLALSLPPHTFSFLPSLARAGGLTVLTLFITGL